jgi:hypothetical protein
MGTGGGEMSATDTRICSTCRTTKLLTEFNRCKSKPKGHQYRCVDCVREARGIPISRAQPRKPQWSAEELAALTLFASQGLSHAEIAVRLNRSRGSVTQRLRTIGIYESGFWKPKEISELKRLVQANASDTSIALALGTKKEWQVQKKRVALGLVRESNQIYRENLTLARAGLKRCFKCKRVLPRTDEYFSAKSRKRMANLCRPCNKEHGAELASGSLERALTSRWRGAKDRAHKGDLEFTISVVDLLTLWEKQEGRCFYSGVTMEYKQSSVWFDSATVTIDRIIPAEGYTPSNIVLCCYTANTLKNAMSVDRLLFWCKAILDHMASDQVAAREVGSEKRS